MTLEQFIKSYKISHIQGYVKDGHLILTRERGRVPVEIEKELPKHEAELMKRYSFPKYKEEEEQSSSPLPVDNIDEEVKRILFKALSDIDLLDPIIERACIRGADGYSDSLFYATFCNMDVKGNVKITYKPSPEVITNSENPNQPMVDWYKEVKSIYGENIQLSDEIKKMLW